MFGQLVSPEVIRLKEEVQRQQSNDCFQWAKKDFDEIQDEKPDKKSPFDEIWDENKQKKSPSYRELKDFDEILDEKPAKKKSFLN